MSQMKSVYLSMKVKEPRFRRLVLVPFLLLAALSTVLAVLYGCTSTLKGDVKENKAPIVQFVNIPPEGQQFSRNPVVYWFGSDPDGLIDYYRYHVVLSTLLGGMAPEDYILTVSDSDWIMIDVDPALEDQQTENSIPLEADENDPVNSYIPQWVFLQAYDMEGMGSKIVFRLFSRNDHPPNTRILSFEHLKPYVDGPPGGIVTGVKHGWFGQDPIDYPGEDPPFEFHWRLYGPYNDSTYNQIVQNFIDSVFVTNDGKLYQMGDTVTRCDTVFGDSLTISCTTVVVNPALNVIWGTLEPYFFVNDPTFVANPIYNAVAESSFDGSDAWVLNTADTMYRVFANDPDPSPLDTTLEKWFVFWVRARDDANVADLTPAFASFTVINPRFEREIGVLDLTSYSSLAPNVPVPQASRKVHWKNVIDTWSNSNSFDTNRTAPTGWQSFITPDYLDAKPLLGLRPDIPLSFLLKHKVIVLYDDAIHEAVFSTVSANVYKAIDAGVNVLATWRAPWVAGLNATEDFAIPMDANFQRYFGVEQLVYSGWFCHAFPSCGIPGTETNCSNYAGRIEDFIGAYAIDSINWPNLFIDDSLLRVRYKWQGTGPFCGTRYLNPALPEVNWSVRTTQTEVLYLYRSLYGPNHPYGGNYNMEGNPVGHRLATFLYRTAHFNFTPFAMEQSSMQTTLNKLFDWLIATANKTATAEIRYPDASHGMSLSESRRAYWKRCEESMKMEDRDTSYVIYLSDRVN
jgi:hypothetical protein